MSEKRKILCVADGGISAELFAEFRQLEELGAEVVIIDDDQITSITQVTDRMGIIEKGGVDAAPTLPALVDNCADADVICVHVASINREVIEAAKKLKVVGILRGGIENADHEALRARGVTLINAPWRSANAVADFTVGMMVCENKNIARSHMYLHQGRWVKKYINQGYIHDMRKCTVGLIGLGNIGRRVIQRLAGFECHIVGYDPFMPKDKVGDFDIEIVDSLDDLVGRCDFISLHLRTSPQSHHLINREVLAKMKPTAYLINTARADLVDEEALVEALKARAIGGAAVDVFDTEPLPADHPYLELDNITLTSHLAGTSVDTMATSVEIGVADVARWLRGEPMENVCY